MGQTNREPSERRWSAETVSPTAENHTPRGLPLAALAVSGALVVSGALSGCASTDAPSGQGASFAAEGLFASDCASCHSAQLFDGMSEERVFRTLDSGIMSPLAGDLTTTQRRELARYITTREHTPPREDAFCEDRRVTTDLSANEIWNGWSPDVRNTRYQPDPGISADEVADLELVWAFGFDEDLSAYSQPAVVGDNVFVGSNAGTIYALDAGTGCIHWTFEAGAPVRTAIVVASLDDGGHAVLFGDQTGQFFALDAASGERLWSRVTDSHPAARITGSPVVHGGTVFVPVASWEETLATLPDYRCCTFRGSVVALRVGTGEEVWKGLLQEETPEPVAPSPGGRPLWGPSGSPVWSTPTVDADRGVLYVTTGNNYTEPGTATSDAVVALDLQTGQRIWSQQVTPGDVFSGCADCAPERGPDFDFGSSVILARLQDGSEILLAGQKSGVVYGLDPDSDGRIVWETRVGEGSSHGGVQWGMATDGTYVYAPVADGALIEVTDDDGVARRRMDPNDGGGLVALRLDDGSVVWEAPPFRVCGGTPNCSPSQLAAATVIPGVVFSGAMDGHLRAYSTGTGTVVLDVDTAREYSTVNGVPANGGALDGDGVVVAGGRIFVNSGYNHFGTMTGNVLLAFAP